MYTGVIVHPTHRVRSGRPVVQLYGRLTEGRPFLVEDDRFRPYFFVRTRDADVARESGSCEIRDTELLSLAGEPVVKLTVDTPAAVRPLRDRLSERGLATFEADLRFPYRYMMDHALRTAIAIDDPPTSDRDGLLYFYNPQLSPCDCDAELSHVSIDLETTADASEIFSVALAGCGVEEVHLVYERAVRGTIVHDDERDLLVATAARIRALDPDLLIGWNVVDFDLRVFAQRCRDLQIPARLCELGRAPGAIELQSDSGFSRQSRASVPGRMVVDGLPLVRDALRLSSYRLGSVAHAVLGRGKLIDPSAADPAAEILRMYRDEPEALAAYNLEDARLVNEILEHEGLLDLAQERSLLSGMQLDRVGASIASFDLLYLPELRIHGRVAPSVDTDREHSPVQGGAVLDPEPGLIERVAVYDFKSLYPSLIRTFNIDPLALAIGRGEPPGSAIVAPNDAHLSRHEAILPRVIERFMARRQKAKERGDRHADQAIKIMMNSMFGVFAAPACRFFSPELANAITTFGQQTLAWTCEAFEAEGVSVLYGDTDSVFVRLPTATGDGDDRQAAESLRERIANALGDRIRHVYDVEVQLELELEKIFDRIFMPRVRGGSSGSKKRYAGWMKAAGEDSQEVLEIVGLESVRRDWPAVTRRLQEGMLRRLFRDEPLVPFTRDVIERVRSGELDDELVYVKRIRKASVDRYTATSPPHVQAARKLEARLGRPVGGAVSYVITRSGPEPLIPGQPLPGQIDHRHYVDRVLRPVAETIFSEAEGSFAEAAGEPEQLSLL